MILMNKGLAYLYLTVMLIVLLWVFVNNPQTLLIFPIFIGLSFIIFCVASAWIYAHDAWQDYRYNRRLQSLLGDRSIEEILKQSPYEYGYVFQGDDGYRVWRKDSIYDFLQSNVSEKFARMWIVEQYVKHGCKEESS